MKKKYIDLIVLFILLLGIFLFYNWRYSIKPMFIYEFGNIAESIAKGKGYSSPFGYESGPTAWMPPLLVYMIVLVYKITGIKTMASFFVIKILNIAFIVLAYFFLRETLFSIQRKINKTLVFILYIFLILLFFHTLFRETNDTPFGIMLMSLALYSVVLFFVKKSKKSFYVIIASSIMLPLGNAIIGIPFILILLFYFLRKLPPFFMKKLNAGSIIFIKKTFIVILFFGLSTLSWTIRNYITFKQFIPTKPNAWYEFYLSNIASRNGTLNYSIYYRYHAIFYENSESLEKIGEKAWLENYKAYSKEYLKSHKYAYVKNVLSRFKNIFVFTNSAFDIVLMQDMLIKLKIEDIDKLTANKITQGRTIDCLDYTDEELLSKLKPLNLSNEKLVYDAWLKAKNIYSDNRKNIVYNQGINSRIVTCYFNHHTVF